MSIDPLAEKRFNISPYAYSSNNPVKRVDPTGMLDDDYFNVQGIFLGSDNASTDFVRVISANKLLNFANNSLGIQATMGQMAEIAVQLQSGTLNAGDGAAISDLVTDVSLSNSAIENITNHYDNALGEVEGKIADVKIGAKSLSPTIVMEASYKSPTKVLGFTLSGEKNRINVNVISGKMSSLLNTGSNIKNSLVHEYKHVSDRKRSQSTNKAEIRAIDAQRSHPSWEGTTPSYKDNIRRYENQNK